jgi:hypothetical protein
MQSTDSAETLGNDGTVQNWRATEVGKYISCQVDSSLLGTGLLINCWVRAASEGWTKGNVCHEGRKYELYMCGNGCSPDLRQTKKYVQLTILIQRDKTGYLKNARWRWDMCREDMPEANHSGLVIILRAGFQLH